MIMDTFNQDHKNAIVFILKQVTFTNLFDRDRFITGLHLPVTFSMPNLKKKYRDISINGNILSFVFS